MKHLTYILSLSKIIRFGRHLFIIIDRHDIYFIYKKFCRSEIVINQLKI